MLLPRCWSRSRLSLRSEHRFWSGLDPVSQFPLVFHDQQAVVDLDPQALATKLAQHFPVEDFAPRNPLLNPFRHRASTAVAGDLTLTSGYTRPIHGRIGDNPGVGAINICYQGESSYGVDGNTFHIHAEAPPLLQPWLLLQLHHWALQRAGAATTPTAFAPQRCCVKGDGYTADPFHKDSHRFGHLPFEQGVEVIGFLVAGG